ncbi:MAG: SpoIID/LytB domain-containing protein [bacterium]
MKLKKESIKRIEMIVVFILLFLFKGTYAADKDSSWTVRIGLMENVSSVSINGQKVTAQNMIEDRAVFKFSGNKWTQVNGKPYRGDIEVRKSPKGGVTVINVLDIDEYLYGVITEEISPAWPREAVKAQIVAARTFALKNAGKHQDEGFDLCTTVHCQVYGGVNSEDRISNKYVDETRGQVITYQGKLINAAYHGICGGMTEDPRNVWDVKDKIPYLTPVICNWCRNAPGFTWEATLPLEKVQTALESAGIKVGKIENIRVSSKSRSGRATEIKILGSKDSEVMSGNKFRLLLGGDILRSTMFRVEKKGDEIVFKGKGWGHGVGLCQEGARGMAAKDYKYKHILRFYYRGTQVEKWHSNGEKK